MKDIKDNNSKKKIYVIIGIIGCIVLAVLFSFSVKTVIDYKNKEYQDKLLGEEVTLSSISISPSSLSLTIGKGGSLSLKATYSDGSTQTITSDVSWRTSKAAVVDIDSSSGSYVAVGEGTAVITASYGGKYATCNVEVNESLTITGISISGSSSVEAGSTGKLSLEVFYSDGSSQNAAGSAYWTSSDTSVISIESSTGSYTAVGAGQSTITVNYGGKTDTHVMTVNKSITEIKIEGESIIYLNNKTASFSLKEYYSDNTSVDVTEEADWGLSNYNVGSIGGGVLVISKTGETSVTANYKGKTYNKTVSIKELTVSCSPESIYTGETSTCTAKVNGVAQTTGVTYSSSNTNFAVVDSSTGVVTGVSGGGDVTITATYNGVKATTVVNVSSKQTVSSISINPSSLSLTVGQGGSLSLIATYSDGTTKAITSGVTWTTSKTEVIDVNASTGQYSAVGVGTAIITASYEGKTAICSVEVTKAIITSISLSPSSVSIAKGLTSTLTIKATYSDGLTKTISASEGDWSTGNPSIATVDDNGVVKGVSKGATTIKVQYDNFEAVANVTITNASLSSIAINPSSLNLTVGDGGVLNLIATYSDGSTQTITSGVEWITSKTEVIDINSSTARYSAVGVGTAIITASYSDKTTIIYVNVSKATSNEKTLVSVSINPSSVSFVKDSTRTLSAMANYNDGTSKVVTDLAEWSSNMPSYVSIEGSVITGLKIGSSIITAVYTEGGVTKSGTCTVSVSNSAIRVTGVTLNKSTLSLGVGDSSQLIATISPGDATNKNLTWTSSDEEIATVVNGIVTAKKIGSAQIKVTTADGSFEALCSVTVTENASGGDGGIDTTLSDVNTLSSLTLSVGQISNFSPNKEVYNVSVPNGTTSITINSTLTDSVNSKYVSGYGNRTITLDNNNSVVYIKVEAQNGIVRTYTLNITKGYLVKDINIANYNVKFSNNTQRYTLKIGSEKSLSFTVTLNSDDYTYQIIDNENLIDGSQVIVRATDGNQVEEYYFVVDNVLGDIEIEVPSTGLGTPIVILIATLGFVGVGASIMYFVRKKNGIIN